MASDLVPIEYDYNDADPYAGLATPMAERPSFSDDSFRYAKSLSNSPYMGSILEYINRTALTARYKNAIYACIYSLLSEERVFAYNDMRKTKFGNAVDPLEVKYLRAQISLEKCRCQATKYDLLIEDIPGLEKQILSVFQDYISRTVGNRKERYINGELPTRSTTSQEPHVTMQMEPARKKKGWLGLGGR